MHTDALTILGKWDGANADEAILKMQAEITKLKSTKPTPAVSISGVTAQNLPAGCTLLSDPNSKKILKDMITEIVDTALAPYVGSSRP